MKIAIDARVMGSRPSGIGIYLYDFVRELVTNSKYCELEIFLICDVAESEQIKFLAQNGTPVICYGKRVFRSGGVYLYFNFVKRILIKEKADIFWEPNNLLPVRLSGYRGKLIVTIHDLFPITKPEYFPWFYRIYFYFGIRKSIKRADALLFNSIETQKLAQSNFPIVERRQNFVSYIIVQRPPARTITDDGFFLYIGNLEKRKGTDLLLMAYCTYCAEGGKKPLYIVGCIREAKIERLLKKIQKECPQLHYLGYVEEKQKFDLLSKCSCFLFPSKAEGFGIPPLEALGYCKPIIASDLSIFKEILKTSVKVFGLEGTKWEQVKRLCKLMLEMDINLDEKKDLKNATKNSETIDLTINNDVLKNYQSGILGERLALFFKSIVEEKDEDRI